MASDHLFLLLNVCVPVYICFTVTISLSECWWDCRKRRRTTLKHNNKKGKLKGCLQLRSTTMMRCIYFQPWDLAPHNMGPKGSRIKTVILLDFNKCSTVIFIKIDFLPLKSMCAGIFLCDGVLSSNTNVLYALYWTWERSIALCLHFLFKLRNKFIKSAKKEVQ